MRALAASGVALLHLVDENDLILVGDVDQIAISNNSL
jgi:hypothetical protein